MGILPTNTTKIFVAVPTNRGVKGLTVESLMKMVKFTPHPMGFNVASEGYTIAENRNCLAARAVKSGSTHLLFIDDDMVFPEDTAVRLLNYGKDIMGIRYHPRQVDQNHIEGMFKALAKDGELPK